jgi:hypothetical protein
MQIAINYACDSMKGRRTKAAIPPMHPLWSRQISVSSAALRSRGPALDSCAF